MALNSSQPYEKDVLILKGLFADSQQKLHVELQTNYLDKLMQRYGRRYQQGEYIFHQGDLTRNLHYLISGQVQIVRNDSITRTIEPGDYFGEMALPQRILLQLRMR